MKQQYVFEIRSRMRKALRNQSVCRYEPDFYTDTGPMFRRDTCGSYRHTYIMHRIADKIEMLIEMRRNERPSIPDRHIPMSVDEASKYLKIPKATLYDKLAKGEIPATKPGKRYVLYKDELDKWLDCNRRTAVPMTPEEENEAILASNRRKPKPESW